MLSYSVPLCSSALHSWVSLPRGVTRFKGKLSKTKPKARGSRLCQVRILVWQIMVQLPMEPMDMKRSVGAGGKERREPGDGRDEVTFSCFTTCSDDFSCIEWLSDFFSIARKAFRGWFCFLSVYNLELDSVLGIFVSTIPSHALYLSFQVGFLLHIGETCPPTYTHAHKISRNRTILRP